MRPPFLLAWAAILALVAAQELEASGVAQRVDRGVADYQHHRLTAAAKSFAAALKGDPSSAAAAYDAGTAALGRGKVRKALSSFQAAATEPGASSSLQAKAVYDQGEALAKLGDKAAAANPAAALGYYRRSVEAFHRALQIEPSMGNAGYNIEVVRHRIEKLRERMKRRPGAAAGKRGGKAHGKGSVRAAGGNGRRAAGGAPNTTVPKNRAPASRNRRNRGGRTPAKAAASRKPPRAAGVPAITARQILKAEGKHPRIMSLPNRQERPNVAKDW